MRREPEADTLEFHFQEALKTLRCARLGYWETAWDCDCAFCSRMRRVLRGELEKTKPALPPYVKPCIYTRYQGRREKKPEAEVTGHVDWWANVTWVCDVCKEERPDSRIGVHAHDISHTMGLPVGCASYNVKYCKDRQACIEGAKDERWARIFEKKRGGRQAA